MRRFMDRLRSLMGNRSKDGEQADGEALEGSTQALLALIPAATVVVDGDGEVVRSSPDAYRLGIVSNDEISNPKIIEAIAQVRRSGGRRSFNLITRTPTEFALDVAAESTESDNWDIDEAEDPGDETHVQAQAVSRRNWLKVTLGRIDQSLVVVLIDDVSDSVRFVRTRDAFMTNVAGGERYLLFAFRLYRLPGGSGLQGWALRKNQSGRSRPRHIQGRPGQDL